MTTAVDGERGGRLGVVAARVVDGTGGSGQGQPGLHPGVSVVGVGLPVGGVREADPLDPDVVRAVDGHQLLGGGRDGRGPAHVLALARQVRHGVRGRVADELARLVEEFGCVLEEGHTRVARGVHGGGVPGGSGAVGAARGVGPAGLGEGQLVAADPGDPAVVVAPADLDDGFGVGGPLPVRDPGGLGPGHAVLGRVTDVCRAGLTAGGGGPHAVDEELARGDAVGDAGGPGPVPRLGPAGDRDAAGEDRVRAGRRGPGGAGVGCGEFQGRAAGVRTMRPAGRSRHRRGRCAPCPWHRPGSRGGCGCRPIPCRPVRRTGRAGVRGPRPGRPARWRSARRRPRTRW